MYVEVRESDPRLKEKKASLSEAELREARCCRTSLTESHIELDLFLLQLLLHVSELGPPGICSSPT